MLGEQSLLGPLGGTRAGVEEHELCALGGGVHPLGLILQRLGQVHLHGLLDGRHQLPDLRGVPVHDDDVEPVAQRAGEPLGHQQPGRTGDGADRAHVHHERLEGLRQTAADACDRVHLAEAEVTAQLEDVHGVREAPERLEDDGAAHRARGRLIDPVVGAQGRARGAGDHRRVQLEVLDDGPQGGHRRGAERVLIRRVRLQRQTEMARHHHEHRAAARRRPPGLADVVRPPGVPGVHAAGVHHGEHTADRLLAQHTVPGDGVDTAVREGAGEQGEVLHGHGGGTHRGDVLEQRLGVGVQRVEGLHQPRSRPGVVLGAVLRTRGRLRDGDLAVEQCGEQLHHACGTVAATPPLHQGGRGHRARVLQRVVRQARDGVHLDPVVQVAHGGGSHALAHPHRAEVLEGLRMEQGRGERGQRHGRHGSGDVAVPVHHEHRDAQPVRDIPLARVGRGETVEVLLHGCGHAAQPSQ